MSGVVNPQIAQNFLSVQSNSGVAAGGTVNFNNFSVGSYNASEAARSQQMSTNGTFYNLYVSTSTPQPSDGNFVLTVRKNGADTALAITIAANAAAGTFTNLSDTVSFVAGDKISVRGVNNSPLSPSATIQSLAVAIR